jgi:hypothetical protein
MEMEKDTNTGGANTGMAKYRSRISDLDPSRRSELPKSSAVPVVSLKE